MSLLILFLSLFLISSSAFSAGVTTYDQLVHAIREVHHASQSRIETAVEQEKVREAWETGKLIQEHILLNKDRAEYGKQVLKKLSSDLNISETELGYMVQFARTYPIYRTSGKLTWGHYETLLAVNDSEERDKIETLASDEQWPLKKLRHEIKRRKVSSSPNAISEDPILEEVKPGKVGVYPVVQINGKNYYDLGFSIYTEAKGKAPKAQPKPEDLYTYKAQLKEVYDGDTFHAYVDLGHGTILEQRLRLRRLDAPEIIEADGKKAKAVLEKVLNAAGGEILIKAAKLDDPYGRYMVDVWVSGKPIEQELLDSSFFLIREDI